MWKCSNCKRVFEKKGQTHSCQSIPLEDHFKNKHLAKDIFEKLNAVINKQIGKTEMISLPCCVHLFGKYDFLAALPKKDKLEIRFVLTKEPKGKRVNQAVKGARNSFSNSIFLYSLDDIDVELIEWLRQSYYLRGE